MKRPCLTCGQPTDQERCPEHQITRPRGSARERGYTNAWDKLSKRARRMQPFCTDCGATDRLTVDHLPTAWQRHDAGLPIRLLDVEVVCGPCNQARGSSRPGSQRARGHEGGEHEPGPLGQGKIRVTHRGGYR